MNEIVKALQEWKEFATEIGVNFDVEYEAKFQTEDFIFPREIDRRGSKVEKLPEGTFLDDIEYFQRKVWTSLAIPKSYLGSPSTPKFRTLVSKEQVLAIFAVIDFDRAMKVVGEK